MSSRNIWTHKGTFLLAAVGSAVGLGNLWRFPYLAGENGGGAFILVYALTIIMVGIPILIAETLLGRSSRRSPILGMKYLTESHGTSRSWQAIGWMGAAAAFLILSFYSVIAGWAIHYSEAKAKAYDRDQEYKDALRISDCRRTSSQEAVP